MNPGTIISWAIEIEIKINTISHYYHLNLCMYHHLSPYLALCHLMGPCVRESVWCVGAVGAAAKHEEAAVMLVEVPSA